MYLSVAGLIGQHGKLDALVMKRKVVTTKAIQRFRAVLQGDERGLGWTVVRLPFVPAEVWPTMVRLRVRGEVNGFPFRTSLFPQTGGTGFDLLVTRAAQKAANVSAGQEAEFLLAADLDERTAELPDELAVLLDEEEGLRAFYDGMTEYMRREIGKWINGVKSDDARLRRVEQMAERLLLTQDGMLELPPVVEAAFQRRPRARAGWKNMTGAQRRHELFAVFYYRTPESREKRVQGLCDVAEKRAG